MNSYSLKAYTASAISFLALHREADCQVVYVDIDPDIVLNEGGQAAELDLDQNGSIDFWFHNNSFTFYSVWFSSYRLMQNILVGPEIEANYIAAETGQYGTAYGGVYTRYYPYAIEAGVKIDTTLNFYNYGLQIMAFKSTMSEFGGGGGVNIGDYAFWFYYLGDVTLNHYLVIKFNSGELTNSFGWIRCDVKDDGRTLVIKDYAYEMTPEYPIIAGDTTHFVEIIDSIPNSPVTIYSFNEILYISLKDSVLTQVKIVNLAGQKINSFETAQKQNTMDFSSLANGIYIVSAEYEGQVYSTKVLIH